MKFALGLLLGFVLGWLSSMIALKSEYLKPVPKAEPIRLAQQDALIRLQRQQIDEDAQRITNLQTSPALNGMPVLTGCSFMRVQQPELQCSRDQKTFRKVAEVRP